VRLLFELKVVVHLAWFISWLPATW